MQLIQNSALPIASLRWISKCCATLLLLGALGQVPSYAEPATKIPAPAVDAPVSTAKDLQTVVVAGGCFWGVQAVYQHVNGVSGEIGRASCRERVYVLV